VAHHCDEVGFTILDLETGKATPVSLPDEVTSDMQLGTARFSPDGSRIAFAAMTGGHGQIEGTRGYIAVSDNLSLSGTSQVIVASQPGEWFTVLGWLSDDRLVLHSYSAGPSGWPAVWTVRADGSGLVKLAEGTFLSGRWYTALY
jgi:tricorn protease-like protein